MLTEYLDKKLKTARYKFLKDGAYFAEIPGVRGVWASARNLETCRTELREVLEDWVLLKVRSKETIPGFPVKVDRRSLVKHG